jgi:acetyl esterase/lipase
MVPKRMISILTKKQVLISFVALCSAACGGRGPSSEPAPVTPAPSGQRASVVESDAGVAISELQARQLLDRLFREAGLRILNDVLFIEAGIEVTLDGYDPERRIGYEYVAREEMGLELSPADLARLRGHPRIFVATGGSHDELRLAAEIFLAAVLERSPANEEPAVDGEL